MIAVWFSCGAASAVAAKKTIERYAGEHEIRVVNNFIKEEHDDNRRFLADVEIWLGQPIETIVSSEYPSGSCDEVWRKKRFMGNIHGAPCTRILKKESRYEWESLHHPEWHVLGFTYDEIDRFENFRRSERENILPVLIDAKITKVDCFMILADAGIEVTETYREGFPNGNCLGCVKATSPTYWNLVRKTHPDVFDARASLSREIGCRLVRHNGKRIFLDELPLTAKGRSIKNMDTEFGIFCQPETGK